MAKERSDYFLHCGLVGNTEDVGSNPGTGRYIVAQMTSGRLKDLKDIDNAHP